MKFYSGSGRHAKKKGISSIIALALIICVAVGGTIAFIVDRTNSVKNTFTPGEVKIDITEKFDGKEKSSIKVENTGNTPAYIRVNLVTYMTDEDGNPTADKAPALSFALNTNDWVKIGDYYYCKNPVAAGETSPELLAGGSSITLVKGQVVDVLAEGIQSTPSNAVEQAWGVSLDGGAIKGA